MTWRTRIIVSVVSVAALGAEALGHAQQTPTEEKVQAFVEQLRGRVSEASFESGHYRHADIAIDVPADWRYGGTIPDALSTDDTAHWTDPKTGIALYVWVSTRRSTPSTCAPTRRGGRRRFGSCRLR